MNSTLFRNLFLILDTLPDDAVAFHGDTTISLDTQLVLWREAVDAEADHPIFRNWSELGGFGMGSVQMLRFDRDEMASFIQEKSGDVPSPEFVAAKLTDWYNWRAKPWLPEKAHLVKQLDWEPWLQEHRAEFDALDKLIGEPDPTTLIALERKREILAGQKLWAPFREKNAGDELWSFSDDQGSMNLRAGFALVREGAIVAAVITLTS